MSDYTVEMVPVEQMRWLVVMNRDTTLCRCKTQADAERIARALRLLEMEERAEAAKPKHDTSFFGRVKNEDGGHCHYEQGRCVMCGTLRPKP